MPYDPESGGFTGDWGGSTFRPMGTGPVLGGGGGGGGAGGGSAASDWYYKSQLLGQQLGAQKDIASGEWANKLALQGQQSALQKQLADISAATSRDVASTQAGAQLGVAGTAAGASMSNVKTQTEAQRAIAQLQSEQAQREALLQQQTAYRGQDTSLKQSEISAEASKYPATMQMARFNTLLPMFQSALDKYTQGGTYGTYGGAGQVGTAPDISAAPIWTKEQIQAQVNANRAATEAATGGKIATMEKGLAGRGFGGNSPLAMALGTNLQGQALAANTAAENALRWQAAQGNAAQVLEGQKAQEAAFASRQSEDIQRNKIAKDYITGIYGMLAGLA